MYRHNAISEGHGFIYLSNPFDLLPWCQTKMAVPAFWNSKEVFAPQNMSTISEKTLACLYAFRKWILKSWKSAEIKFTNRF